MAVDASGTPTSPDSIPKYATSADAPSGKGFNAAMDAIQTALSARVLKNIVTTAGDLLYATGASTLARLGIGSNGQVLTVAGGVPTWATPSSSAMVLIADQLLGGSQASFDTNTILGGNIPQTYKHLRLILNLRGTNASAAIDSVLSVNNDTSASYEYQARYSALSGASSVSAASAQNAVPLTLNATPAASATSLRCATVTVDFIDYAAQNFVKTFHYRTYGLDATTQYDITGTAMWPSASNITRLAITPSVGSFATGSRFSLYGIN